MRLRGPQGAAHGATAPRAARSHRQHRRPREFLRRAAR
jgi:hypothetical protein